jgi:hypothetical protein
MQKLNNSLAKEPISTQVANKCATQKLDTKDKKADLQSIVKRQMQASKCQSTKKLLQLLIDELLFVGTLEDWKAKLVSFQQRKRIPHHSQAFSVLKTHKIPSLIERLCKLGVLKWQQASK